MTDQILLAGRWPRLDRSCESRNRRSEALIKFGVALRAPYLNDHRPSQYGAEGRDNRGNAD